MKFPIQIRADMWLFKKSGLSYRQKGFCCHMQKLLTVAVTAVYDLNWCRYGYLKSLVCPTDRRDFVVTDESHCQLFRAELR